MNLLVCLSFSEPSEHSLRYGLQLAAQLEAGLTVLHVYPDREDKLSYLPDRIYDSLLKEGEFSAQKHFLQHLKHLRAQVNEVVSVHPLLKMGKPEQVIPEVASSMRSDLVILGMSQSARTSLRWSGGLMAQLYRHSDVPLLVVPEDAVWRHLDHVVYATRFDETETRIPQVVGAVAGRSGAHISCVHITTPRDRGRPFKDPVLEKMYRMELDPSYQVCFYSLFHKGPASGLKTFTELYQTDLFGLLYLRKSGFSKLFQRSLARKMLYELAIPVLVVPQ